MAVPLVEDDPMMGGARQADASQPRLDEASGDVVFTTQYWPMIISILPPRITESALERYFAHLDQVLEIPPCRFASLIDPTALAYIPPASARARLGELQEARREVITRTNIVTVVVVRNSLIRTSMNALNWVFRPRTEQTFVRTWDDGFRLCIQRLQSEGIGLSEALARHAQFGTVPSVKSVVASAVPEPPDVRFT